MIRIYEWLRINTKVLYFAVGFIVLSVIYLYFYLPPKDFPKGTIITITSGQTLQDITRELYLAKVIRSPFAFRVYVILMGGEKRVIAGDYLLDDRAGPADMAYRLVGGKFHLDTIKVTIPEGWNIFEIGQYLEETLKDFDREGFLRLAKSLEGFLFPDTYFITEQARPDTVVGMMNNNFAEQISAIPEISTSKYSLQEIITMASIVEDEAMTTESRRIVSGILWKRLSLGMLLQVDSTFSYINGKNTYELTLSDLKIDSPYNTYKYSGLPPGPISNPGLDSIMAVINPTDTKYLYFLSEKDGTMHYATTFEGHVRNKEKYLK